MSTPPKPTPASMPQRRRPAIPPRPPAPSRSAFRAAKGYPRRGWPDATVWPDTGIWLTLGVAPHLAGRFVRQYGGRVRVPRAIEREVRRHAQPGGATEHEQRKAAVAGVIMAALFLGKSRFPQPELIAEDLPVVDRIREALKNLPGGSGKAHGGEAELIALAVRQQDEFGTRQVLLSNDGGASVVAAQYQIPTRHAADVLAEFACADHGLSPAECAALFKTACEISAPPAVSRPADDSAFTCDRADGLCTECDNAG